MPLDLRRDSVTRPSAPMRAALAAAEVAAPHRADDPPTPKLEQRGAALPGTAPALCCPASRLANLAAIRVRSPPGSALLVDAGAHFVNLPAAGTAAVAAVQSRFPSTTA